MSGSIFPCMVAINALHRVDRHVLHAGGSVTASGLVQVPHAGRGAQLETGARYGLGGARP